MSKLPTGPQEETKRLVPRRTTDKRGGMTEPDPGFVRKGRSPFRRLFRRGIPQDPPKPDFKAKPRNKQGSHLENDIKSDFYEGPKVGPSGDSRSMVNPVK